MFEVQHYLAFYRAADSELTLGEIGRYRHQHQGVGYIYKVGLQTGKKGELHRILYENEKEINLSF